jgi:hypothetical protein
MGRRSDRMTRATTTLIAAWVLLGCPGCSRADLTPEDTFRRCVEHVREGEYDEVWDYYSDRMKAQWAKGVAKHKEILRRGGPNRAVHVEWIQKQYLSGPEEFLSLSPKDLLARALAARREWILEWRIVKPARIVGDTATLTISTGKDHPEWEWTLKEIGGAWFVHDVPHGDPSR